MNNKAVQVKMLGEFFLSWDGIVVDGRNSRSRKGKSLLAYLVYHRDRMVSIDELIRILGSDKKNAAPIAALRTTLYRVRHALEPIEHQTGMPLIVTQNGTYGWNPAVAVELDTTQFEANCRNGIPRGSRAGEYLSQTLELYRGDFMCSLASESWVEPLAEYYRSLYLSAVECAVPIFLELDMVQKAVEFCRTAIRISPYSEALYRWLMRAYAAQDDSDSAAAVYEELRTVLYRDLGVIPENETRQIYQDILLSAGKNVLTADSIKDQLQEHTPISGALICDYASFKLFYQAEARAAARRGDAIHIGILSVLSRNGRPLPVRSLKRAMEQLHIQISQSLRTGDIASCCSSSQYILMLVQANYENSKRVCERVVQDFLRAHPRSPIRIQSVVFPLEPILEQRERA